MGSRSRSTTTVQETAIQDIDTTTAQLEDIDGLGIANVGGDVAVQVSDQGAIEAARDIGLSALDFGGGTVERAFDFGADIFGESVDFLGETTQRSTRALAGAIQTAGEQTRSDTANLLGNVTRIGAILAGVLGIAFFVSRARA